MFQLNALAWQSSLPQSIVVISKISNNINNKDEVLEESVNFWHFSCCSNKH